MNIYRDQNNLPRLTWSSTYMHPALASWPHFSFQKHLSLDVLSTFSVGENLCKECLSQTNYLMTIQALHKKLESIIVLTEFNLVQELTLFFSPFIKFSYYKIALNCKYSKLVNMSSFLVHILTTWKYFLSAACVIIRDESFAFSR